MYLYNKIFPYYFPHYYPTQQFIQYSVYQRERIWEEYGSEDRQSAHLPILYKKYGKGEKNIVKNPTLTVKDISVPGALIGREQDTATLMSWQNTPEFKRGTCGSPIKYPCLKMRKSKFHFFLIIKRIPLKKAFQKHYQNCLYFCIPFAQTAAAAAWEETITIFGPVGAAIAATKAAAIEAWGIFSECMVAFIGWEALKNSFEITADYTQEPTSGWETVNI
ncbi:hypothetical protein [Bacillus toyonensis]|uniref:hypothetical protein n=1 Tax=Bacillus toyonensis TaxID=155322 RepID=UPI0021CE0480|nr:hypothetical protein [Bacillus toyonensis]MCU4771037.1 hypothetical protein [Bacillus toyonensis]